MASRVAAARGIEFNWRGGARGGDNWQVAIIGCAAGRAGAGAGYS